MNRSKADATALFPWILGSIAFGCLVFLLLPGRITPFDDDFGYLRSVVATIQRGRPWTDEWLEPWAAGLSVAGAWVYRVTDDFYLATYGLLAVLAGCTFGALSRLLIARGFTIARASGLAVLLLTFPSVLWKLVEFTGMALYLPCLLWAIWAYETRRCWLFTVCWCVAITTRQSAIAWIVLPLLATAAAWRGNEGKPSARAVLGWSGSSVIGGALILVCRATMNKTNAQAVLTDPMLERFSFSTGAGIAWCGVVIFLLAAGVGLFFLRSLDTPRPRGWRWRHPGIAVPIALAGLALVAVDPRRFILWEVDSLQGTIGFWYITLVVLVATTTWAGRGGTFRVDYSLGALASLALVCLRPQVWDYYFLDVAVFGFLGAVLSPGDAPRIAASRPLGSRATRAVLAASAVASFILLLDLKVFLDRGSIICGVAEKALREHRLTAAELSFVPFGYLGWKLYPYFHTHEGKNQYIAGFDRYLVGRSIGVGSGYSPLLHALPRFRHDPPADRSHLVAEGGGRLLWFFRANHYLVRLDDDRENPRASELPADFLGPPLPLNESEWGELIRGSAGVAPSQSGEGGAR